MMINHIKTPHTILSVLLGLSLMQSVVAVTRTTSTTYDPVTQQIATIDGPRVDVSDITTNDYDPTTGNLIKVTNALGHQTTISNHDANGRPRTITDPNGLITTLTYHPRGWLTTRTVDGNTTTFDYDNVGQLIKLTLPTNAFISYTYDAAHRLTDITDNLGNTIHYTLDPMGNRTKEQTKDSSGNIKRVLEREYDQLSQLLLLIGGEGQLTRYAYDLNGNQTALTDPRNTGNNRATAKTLNPLQTDNTSQSLYDALNRLVEVTQLQSADNGADDVTTNYEYNALDQLVKVTDPNGLATTYTYNALGDLLQLNSPDTGTTTYTYDEAGNRKTQTDARNITTAYSYDALNRLTTVSYPDTSLNITYTYDDNNNNQNGIGRLTSMSDASGTTQYSYDKRGNQTAMTTTRSAVILTTAYAYNAADQLTQITYPSGRTVDYAYDAANRISGVTTTDAQGTQTLLSNIDYQPFGPMNSMTYGNNLTNTQSYDLDYRQTSIDTSGVLQRQYDFDEASNITDISNSLNTTNNQTFLYDGLSRLEDAQGSYGSLGYQYDKTSNRLQKTDNGSTNTYHYPIDSHHLQDINSSERYRYDANGNTTQLPNPNIVTDLTYGDHNRLTQVNGVTYTYNGRGERVIKDNGSATTHYYYDQNGQLLTEADANGNIDKEYLMLNGQLIALTAGTASGGDQDQDGIPNHQDNCRAVANAAQLDTDNDDFGNRCDADFDNNGAVSFKDLNYFKSVFETQDPLADIDGNGMVNHDDLDLFKTLFGKPPGPGASVSETIGNGLYYVHNDHLGTPQVMTDNDQAIVWEAEYDPFGKATVTTETVTNNVRFPGQYFDVETGLHYNYFRTYDPVTGRYITSDPIGLAAGPNTYLYANANPVFYVDPDGQIFVPGILIGGGVGALAGVATALFTDGDILQSFIIGATSGAIAGSGAGLGLIAGSGLGFAVGFGSNAVTQGLGNGFECIDFVESSISGLASIVGGGIGSGIARRLVPPRIFPPIRSTTGLGQGRSLTPRSAFEQQIQIDQRLGVGTSAGGVAGAGSDIAGQATRDSFFPGFQSPNSLRCECQ